MDEYFDHDQFDENEVEDGEQELYHYGVLGMKWGVRRASRKEVKNQRLERKALKYDIKSAEATKKSEKIHADKDLDRSNRAAAKAAKYDVKANKLRKKALNATSEVKKSSLERRAAKADFKSATKQLEANKLSKMTGYGDKAMKYSMKSDKLARKAAKARLKIANNKRYIAKMESKVNDLPEKDLEKGRNFIENTNGGE